MFIRSEQMKKVELVVKSLQVELLKPTHNQYTMANIHL